MIISGPCVIESFESTMKIAQRLKSIKEGLGVEVVFKASFDKANRSSMDSFRGPGIEKGLEILKTVKEETGLELTTDIHESWQADVVAEVVDIIQIPAFLCRQTDLLFAAANTGCVVNIKKAQFLPPSTFRLALEKTQSITNKVMVTERGSYHGFGSLVVDFLGVKEMLSWGVPVIMDCTHAAQIPSVNGAKTTGGNRAAVPTLAKLAHSIGVEHFFFESHFDPDNALSDAPNTIGLNELEHLIPNLI